MATESAHEHRQWLSRSGEGGSDYVRGARHQRENLTPRGHEVAAVSDRAVAYGIRIKRALASDGRDAARPRGPFSF